MCHRSSEDDNECFVFPRLQGNKKGPLGRWDFDTQEEYSDYMNNKEALPKYCRFPAHAHAQLTQVLAYRPTVCTHSYTHMQHKHTHNLHKGLHTH